MCPASGSSSSKLPRMLEYIYNTSVFRWGWVQYVSILLVFMYISSGVKDYVFSQQILPTMVSRTDK